MNHKKIANNLKVLSTLTIVGLILSGCTGIKNLTGKRDNSSLNYQKSKLLSPIQIPIDKNPQQFASLYPLVKAGKNELKLTNKSGKQYQLPKPIRTVN